MVHSHVERNGSGLHLNYYDVDQHKEGSMDLRFVNPTDGRKLHDNDRVEVLHLTQAGPQHAVTLHVSHPDGTSDDIPCRHSGPDV